MIKFFKELSIEKIFVILALIFGVIYAIITPPFQSVDEHFHFYRAYSISQGKVTAQRQNSWIGEELPVSLIKLTIIYDRMVKDINEKTSLKELKHASKIPLEKDKTSFANFPNTALYSPAPYIAQSIGIKCAEILHLNPIWYIYFGRIFNLLLYCFVGFCAIKTIPYLKEASFLLLLMPMSISMGASLSTDATIISISVLFFALILKSICVDENLSTKRLLLLASLGAVLALSKHNFFLLPLIFLISPKKFGKLYILKLLAFFTPAFVLTALWSGKLGGLYIPLNPQADMFAQISFILLNPIKFVGVIINTIILKTFRLIITGIGVLGWQDTRLDILTYILYPVALISSIFYEKSCVIFSKLQNFIIGAVIGFSYLIIVTYMYLSWSKVGNPVVIGLNGKYLLPLVLPAMLLIKNLINKEFYIPNYQRIMYSFCFLILLSSAFSILIRFYNVFPNLNYAV